MTTTLRRSSSDTSTIPKDELQKVLARLNQHARKAFRTSIEADCQQSRISQYFNPTAAEKTKLPFEFETSNFVARSGALKCAHVIAEAEAVFEHAFIDWTNHQVMQIPEPLQSLDGTKAAYFENINSRLRDMKCLVSGWDGYAANPPSMVAIKHAKAFLQVLRMADLLPDSVNPSVVGGVGVTLNKGDWMIYVEFLDSGSVLSLCSNGVGDDDVTEHRTSNSSAYLEIIDKVRALPNA